MSYELELARLGETWSSSWQASHLQNYPGGVQTGGPAPVGGASLPGKCLTGCCFQSRWWYYILSGWRRRGSPVGASRRPGEVCWSLRGAAHTHTRHTHRWSVSATTGSLTLTLVLTARHVETHNSSMQRFSWSECEASRQLGCDCISLFSYFKEDTVIVALNNAG